MWLDDLSAEERLIAEQAVLDFRSLNKASDAAGDGTVSAVAEELAVELGRELTRRTLQAALVTQIEAVEKSSPARTCECKLRKSHHGRRVRKVQSCAGQLRLSRQSYDQRRNSEASTHRRKRKRKRLLELGIDPDKIKSVDVKPRQR